jgi:CopA family copper-resistance protein
MKKNFFPFLAFVCFLGASVGAAAKTVHYDLTLSQGRLTIEGREFSNKVLVNGSLPAPLLVFHEGDVAEIRVINRLDEPTAIHWHGILLPNDQDGVPFLTSLPIPPQGEKTYSFPVIQTGTYWYHSHVMFQEQDGVYGPIKILPKKEVPGALPEEVILFSDFTQESGAEIHKNLKKDGEYYGIFKGTVHSWWKAFKTGVVGTRLRNSLQRMGGMDVADIAYDDFLANGKKRLRLFTDRQQGPVKLRLINGSSSSIYGVTYGGGPLTIVASDGQPVEPLKVEELRISVGETFDVLVDLEKGHANELRATSIDNSGFASVFLGKGLEKAAPSMSYQNPMGVTMGEMMGMPGMSFWEEFKMSYTDEFSDIPREIQPELKDRYLPPTPWEMNPMMAGMNHGSKVDHEAHMDMDMDKHMHMDKPMHMMHMEDPAPKVHPEMSYDLLRAMEPIHVPADQKLRIYRFTLNGNMENYTWSINGRPLGPETYIKIRHGERVRFIMQNTTMMNHPMHLHGHFFRVMTKQGAYSPLKHTVNVGPMGTTVIEFNATEEKDWFFHCHILYHMMDGMTRIVRYEDNPGPEEFTALRKDSMEYMMPSHYYLSTKALAQTNYARLEGKYFNSLYQFSYEADGNYEKDLDAEIHAARTLTRYSSLYVGGKSEEREGVFDFSPALGFTWVLPLEIEMDVKYQPLMDHPFELELENSLQLAERLLLNYKWSTEKRFLTELEYRKTKNLSFVGSYSETYRQWGLGLGYTY